MMHKLDVSFNYNPRTKLYRRKDGNTEQVWIEYYLPNKKRIRRYCDQTMRAAKVKLRQKQSQLHKGYFDDFDMERLEGWGRQIVKNLAIPEGIKLYLELSSPRKNIKSHQNDVIMTNHVFTELQSLGVRIMADAESSHIDRLVLAWQKKQYSAATIRDKLMTISKCYNFLKKRRLIECDNPVVDLGSYIRHQSTSRDRILSKDEFYRLVDVCKSWKWDSHGAPIGAIVLFTMFTGMRRGEVLHLEWSDINLDEGFVEIRSKPECPTKYELGWEPKHGRERGIPLLPEAIFVLESIPQFPTVGRVQVRNEAGKIVDHDSYPAEFIFPKRIIHSDGTETYERVDDIKKGWLTLVKQAGIANVRFHDLRRTFNSLLKNHYYFSSKEASDYIGNSQMVNDRHYTAVDRELLMNKMKSGSMSEKMGVSLQNLARI